MKINIGAHHRFKWIFPVGLFGIVSSGVLIYPMTATRANADSRIAQINPCPSLYYEEPFNSNIPAPPSCPPNAVGNRDFAEPEIQNPVTPSPETLQDPVTMITTSPESVDIRLVNETGTMIIYQSIGDTEQRMLEGGSETVLRDIETPVTVTFTRPDSGLLMARPEFNIESGILDVILDETASLDEDDNAITIQESGEVYLN
ncbi:MAG TPA: hypothetical protein ACFE0H_06315 [Elainellaceae cyanobacterium]